MLTTAYGLIAGNYQSLMLLAVDKAGELPEGITHDQMSLSFIGISLGGAVVLIIAAGILVWKASDNKKWSIWALTAFAIWQAVGSLYANIQLKEMYPGPIGLGDWVLSIIVSLLWLYMLFAAHKLKPQGAVENNAH